jgi:septum formation protein
VHELHEIVLASASPRRRELLTSLGLRVVVVPSDVDEGERPGYAPRELASLHAAAKAEAVAARDASQLIVAADTVVDVDGTPLGKPRDPAEAVAMLRTLSGREHLVHTAYTVVDGPSARRLNGVQTTRVRFHPLSEEEIEAYVASGDPFDKAGGYGIQGRGAVLVAGIDGDFYTVMGLPLGTLVRRLRELGYTLPAQARS